MRYHSPPLKPARPQRLLLGPVILLWKLMLFGCLPLSPPGLFINEGDFCVPQSESGCKTGEKTTAIYPVPTSRLWTFTEAGCSCLLGRRGWAPGHAGCPVSARSDCPLLASYPSGRGHLSPMRELALFFLWHFLFLFFYLSVDFTVLWADHAEIYGAEEEQPLFSRNGCVCVTVSFLGTGVCVCTCVHHASLSAQP